ncbi:hypothetical protein IID19_04890 [Patescibacteria group bacterium]|nr:hypothetical protein [Patescibacteria group bacterium]
MSSLQLVLQPIWKKFEAERWTKIMRPGQCLLAGLAAAIIAFSINPLHYELAVLVGSFFCAGCSCLGASLFHYGTRHDMYRRKTDDPVIVHNPMLLVQLGAIAFASSMAAALYALPTFCVAVALGNFTTITLYGLAFDRVWPFKNILAAAVCITPLVIGGATASPDLSAISTLLLAAFGIYLSREIIKDIKDVRANRGLRFTLVMYFGDKITLSIAGTILLLAAITLFYAFVSLAIHNTLPIMLAGLAIIIIVMVGVRSIVSKQLRFAYQQIDVGVGCILLALLANSVG